MTSSAPGGGERDTPTEPLPQAAPAADPGRDLPEVGSGARASPSPLGRAAVLVGAALVAVAVGLLVANAWLTRSAEDAAAERAEAVLDAPAAVRLQGWPVGLRLVTGRPVDAVVHATDVPLEGTSASVSFLQVELEEVVLDRRALEDGTGGLEAARGSFLAELDADAVQALAGLIGRLPLVGVELRSGVARLNVAGFPVLDATAEVADGAVVFSPTAPLGSFAQVQLEFDALPLGFRVDRVEIRRDVLRLEGSATGVRIGGVPALAGVSLPPPNRR